MAKELKPSEEQLAYAVILDWGMKLGLIGICITFAVYVFKLLPPYVPLNLLPILWKLNAHAFLEAIDYKGGWAWINNLGYGDFLNYIPIAFLGALTIICYLRIIPIFFKKKDLIYGILSIIQVLILILAASGILRVGGH